MSRSLFIFTLVAALPLIFLLENDALAQQTAATTGTPFTTSGHSFYEQSGFNANYQHNRGNVRFNLQLGPGRLTNPGYGGVQPNNASGFGIGFPFGGGSLNGRFGFNQGSNSRILNQTPTMTGLNGTYGFVGDVSQSPFVIGVIPNVGDRPVFRNYGASNTVAGRYMRGEWHLDDQGRIQLGPKPSTYPMTTATGPEEPDFPQQKIEQPLEPSRSMPPAPSSQGRSLIIKH
ncbi:Hypothetical protein PBC10988_33370 [Planctomycetales bacterium 10988]|nr:Hypothetical protein PBC10988_33370 [Planctomycetales bacterium 10988]